MLSVCQPVEASVTDCEGKIRYLVRVSQWEQISDSEGKIMC